MGYYIDFVFNDNSVSGYEDLVERFCKAGAVVFDYSKEDLSDHERKKLQNYVDLQYSKFRYFIRVYKKESRNLKGNWAYVRLSWGERPESFVNTVKHILELADSIGCRIYDGQINDFVTFDTINEVLKSFVSGANWVIGAFGKIERQKE